LFQRKSFEVLRFIWFRVERLAPLASGASRITSIPTK
jgi:hypothetical protein